MRDRVVLHWPARSGRGALHADPRVHAPAIDFAGPIPWPVLQSLFDALYPPGLQWYWKADFFNELDDRAIELHVKYAERLPTMQSTMHLYPINGAAHRVGKNDTAFSFRDANFAEVIVGVDPDPANNERMIQWAKDYWMALHPYSAGGAYVNMSMDEGEDLVQGGLSRQLRATGADQGQVRSQQSVPREPEHPAGGIDVASGGKLAEADP